MTKTKLFAALLAASVSSTAAYAAPAMNNASVTKADAMAKADARFAKMDVNSDGMLNQADREARVKQRFAKMDADSNGSVSESEFTAAREVTAEKRTERRKMRAERKGGVGHEGHRMGGRGADGKRGGGGMKMLARAHTNGDKAVTKAEFRAAVEARFARVDANNDGSISADERRAHRDAKRSARRPANVG